MDMIEHNIILGVNRYALKENKLFTVIESNIKIYDLNNLDDYTHELNLDAYIQNVIASNNNMLFSYGEKYATGVYNLQDQNYKITDDIIADYANKNSNIFFGNKQSGYVKYNFAEDSTMWEIEGRLFGVYHNDKYLIAKKRDSNSVVYIFDKLDGSQIQRFELKDILADIDDSKKIQYRYTIGCDDQSCYLYCNYNTIVRLNIETGELIRIFDLNEYLGNELSATFYLDDNYTVIGICEKAMIKIKDELINYIDLEDEIDNNDIRSLITSSKVSEIGNYYIITGLQKMKYDIEDFIPGSYIIALDKSTNKITSMLMLSNINENPVIDTYNIYVKSGKPDLFIIPLNQLIEINNNV